MLFFLLITAICSGQDFVGKNVELLNGKVLIVKEKDKELQRFGYDNFFTDENLKNKYAKDSSIFNTPYDSLVTKKFKVIDIKPFKDGIGSEYFILKLENEKTGILYFQYNPKNEFKFVFNVEGGVVFPDGYWCNDIKIEKDKFTNVVTKRSPLLERIAYSKEKGIIDISINIPGSTVNFDGKGVILLLSDGTKISKPNQKISVDYRDGYRYSAYFQLNKIEIDRIIKNPITDVKLYIYDAEIFNPKKYSEYLKCLVKM